MSIFGTTVIWLVFGVSQFVSKPPSCSIAGRVVRIERAQQRRGRRRRCARRAARPARLARRARVRDQAAAGATVHRRDRERRYVCQAQPAAVGSRSEVSIIILLCITLYLYYCTSTGWYLHDALKWQIERFGLE